ncbi:hypothetical protein ACWEQC_02545 [Streptomyces shenzhenensis]
MSTLDPELLAALALGALARRVQDPATTPAEAQSCQDRMAELADGPLAHERLTFPTGRLDL